MGRLALLFFFGFLLNQGKALSQLSMRPLLDSIKGMPSFRLLPQNLYNQHLSFFCKKEVQLQKLISLPVYIRLGAKEYVDYLEKKPNAAWLPKH